MYAFAPISGLIQVLRHDRALLWGVLASMALHGLLLLGFYRHDAPAPPAKMLWTLTARLAPVATATSELPSRSVSLPAKPLPAARFKPNLPAATPAPVAQRNSPAKAIKAALPGPESAARQTAQASVNTAAREPISSAAFSAAVPVPSAAKAMTAAPGSARPVPQMVSAAGNEPGKNSAREADNQNLAQYRQALIAATRRYKRYPAIAMEKGWQGRVEVRMAIGAGGTLASALIKASSGHEVLDDQAKYMLVKGKAMVQIPVGLRGRAFSVDVPVIFSLDDPSS